MNTGEEGFKVYQRTSTKNMGDKEQRPPPSDEMRYLQELILRNQKYTEQIFQRTMRASMIELIQAIQGAPELKKTLGEGSSFCYEKTSINPPTRTFCAKSLQREEEEQVEITTDWKIFCTIEYVKRKVVNAIFEDESEEDRIEVATDFFFKEVKLNGPLKHINKKRDNKYMSLFWQELFHLTGQWRSMFIQTQSTPNPLSLMFNPGKPVMEVGSADIPNARSAMGSPLAKALFGIDGVARVYFGSDYITVTKSEQVSWDILKPEIFAAVMDFYSSGQPLFFDSKVGASKDTAITEDDDETVAMIKELLETRIRPAVQDDGGDIEYCGFDPETGVVKLKMQGACSGCPSSALTLKSGIENMLMHYVPE
ncbi:hypothetical protein KI387_036119, partial [Taxus chinensis]